MEKMIANNEVKINDAVPQEIGGGIKGARPSLPMPATVSHIARVTNSLFLAGQCPIGIEKRQQHMVRFFSGDRALHFACRYQRRDSI